MLPESVLAAAKAGYSELFNRLHSLIFRESQINGSFFTELPPTCRNARLFYKHWFAPVSSADIVSVGEPVQVVFNEQPAVAFPLFISFKNFNYLKDFKSIYLYRYQGLKLRQY